MASLGGKVTLTSCPIVNPEFDGLLDKFVSTIPWAERIQVLRQVMRHISENLNQMGLFYDMEFTQIGRASCRERV